MLSILDGILIPIHMNNPDHLTWNDCNSKSYSVSSMYNLSLIPPSNSEINSRYTIKWIWKNAAPFRVQCFTWMVLLGKLKKGDFLLKIGIIHKQNQALCKFCNMEVESVNHSLLLCYPVWSVWCEILEWWGMVWVSPHNVETLFNWWFYLEDKKWTYLSRKGYLLARIGRSNQTKGGILDKSFLGSE